MAYIQTIHGSEATDALGVLYKKYANADGSVDAVLKVHGLNPASLEAHMTLYLQAMKRSSPLSRVEREMVAVTVSRINGCGYCLTHHARGLVRLLPDDRKGVGDRLVSGDVSGLSARERAMVEHAELLTREPAGVARAHIDELRASGLTDVEILDLTQVIGYFAYANRIVLGLGVELESG